MGNWKELGEVPDSDDDGWDSDDSPQRLPLSDSQPRPQLDSHSDNVWKCHGSPSSHPTATTTFQKTQTTTTQLQSPVSKNIGIETGETETQLYPAAASNLQDDGDALNEEYGSPDPLAGFPPESLEESEAGASGNLPDRSDDVSPSTVRITASTADPFPGSSSHVSGREPHVVDKHSRGNETHQEAMDNAKSASSLSPKTLGASAPGRRSLRPRKPIQEHPYLLENAQYSKAFKSHGLKPIRIAAPEQMCVRRRNEDTQDPEFIEDESQSVGLDEESQGSLRKSTRSGLNGDLDELVLSQSPGTSSPQRRLRASSEQSPGQQTEDTSVHEDEDFPDIGDLVANKKTPKRVKRRATSQSSTSRKRLRTKDAILDHESPLHNIWDIPPSPEPVASSSRRKKVLSPMESARPSFNLPAISRPVSPGQLTPAPRPLTLTEPTDLTALISESEEESEVHRSDCTSSDSESDLIRRTGRRIRGVLPASWLRLDQQTRTDTTNSTKKKSSPPRSPNQPRPGLATKRSGLPKSRATTRSFFAELDESDDEDQEIERITNQAAHHINQEQDFGGLDNISLDDNASVVEDNFIDLMLPVKKRQRSPSIRPPRKRKKTQRGNFIGSKRYQQSKISASMHRLDRLSKSAARSRYMDTSVQQQVKRATSPPALSIADVVEPDAPRFIKIAARVATKRNNMGRSKPSNKSINLGTRRDNVDALSILKRWRAGSIKQRTPRTTQPITQRKPTRSREPLKPKDWIARRPSQPSKGLSFYRPKKFSRQVSLGNFVSTEKIGICSERPPLRRLRLISDRLQPQDPSFGYRPAQLETDVLQGDDLVVFGARKRMLDLVFRKGRKEMLAPTFQLRQSSPDAEIQPELSEAVPRPELGARQLDQREEQTTRQPSRHRKRMAPRHLDLNAPQYKYANGPLPFFGDHPSPIEEDMQPQGEEGNKIIGLGPLGTHYTQHFDMFPLPGGTFFHHTTIIGDGTLNKALGYTIRPFVTGDGLSISLHFSSYHFQWGRWTDTTSSELGLLFDSIAEHVESNEVIQSSLDVHQVVDAAGFVLKYVFEFASLNEQPELEYFTQRMFKLLAAFLNHASHSTSNQHTSHALLQATSRFLLCALVILRLCQGTAGLSNQAPEAEDILTRLAKLLIQKLLSIGLSDVRTAYDDLHRSMVRERGIRNDNVAVTTWVIVMKVLSSAQIPKAGFWDLVSAAMTIELGQIIDAQRLERHWRDMFTLLPLTEFDDFGILRKGARYVAPLQGWNIAQKLLKAVFESYQANERQSPSFNDYCRALLGRCHYLIEQWGWQRCIGIVGTIFDFFGRENLSNLRNEEVYKSARFLEDLSDEPCLSVEPEDRSFHIFLKILAVAIQGLRRRGLSNDIRNLVTRCLPNHDRQYSKEQTIHTHELASLRNHHDLLCTLFWAAPPESRRPVALIEELVRPATSHKEACLINLRAWSQLARFVVSSGSSVQDYRPFMSWQNNVFQQVLNQYLSAAADVEDQLRLMAKEDRGNVHREILDSIVAANQNAAKDVLYFSVMASLDVMKHCQSLTAATFSFNVSQMAKTFNNLINEGTDLDWGILRATFDTVDNFVTRLEGVWYSLRESTGDSASTHANRDFEDAVEFLDDKLIESFIATTRKVMLSPACAMAFQIAHPIVEKAVVVCGRIASLFIDGGKSTLLHFFSPGKYGLFEALPSELGLVEWKCVPLFVSTLLRHHVFSFSSIGCTHFDIWISLLIKPSHASVIRYEVDLAETLKTLDMGYMAGTGTLAKTTLDYTKRRDLFSGAISYMRREVRQADFAQRKHTRAKYEKTLKAVMRQIRSAIQSLQLNSKEHSDYVQFIRDIVGLIKSHGADICSIDPYFYQVSAEYSPPKEDPQLHTAGILAYGIRLGEGETTAIPQLFSYLYNHFKTSLSSDQLNAEIKIIENGLKDDNVLAFVISRMLPAIIQTIAHKNDIWPLLDVYAQALYNSLTRSCLPREVPEDAVDDVVVFLTTVLSWAQDLRENSSELTPTQAHIFAQLLKVCNAIRPSLACWLLQSSATTLRLQGCVIELARVAKQAAAVLGKLHESGSGVGVRNVSVKDLVLAKIQLAPLTFDNHIRSFKQSLLRDVLSNWVITSDHVTVRVAATPSTQRGMQTVEGIKNDLHTRVGLLSELLIELKVWVSEVGEGEGRRGPRGKRNKPRGNPTGLGMAF